MHLKNVFLDFHQILFFNNMLIFRLHCKLIQGLQYLPSTVQQLQTRLAIFTYHCTARKNLQREKQHYSHTPILSVQRSPYMIYILGQLEKTKIDNVAFLSDLAMLNCEEATIIFKYFKMSQCTSLILYLYKLQCYWVFL